MFAASFLRGTAFRWIQPQLEKDPLPYELSTFSSFAQELKRVFGDPEEVATARMYPYNFEADWVCLCLCLQNS